MDWLVWGVFCWGLVICRGRWHVCNEGMFWWWTGRVGYRPCQGEGFWKSRWGFAVGVSRRLVLPTYLGRVGVFLELSDWIFLVLGWRIQECEFQPILRSNSVLGTFCSIGNLPSWVLFYIFLTIGRLDGGRWLWRSILLQSRQHTGKSWSCVSCVSIGLCCLA